MGKKNRSVQAATDAAPIIASSTLEALLVDTQVEDTTPVIEDQGLLALISDDPGAGQSDSEGGTTDVPPIIPPADVPEAPVVEAAAEKPKKGQRKGKKVEAAVVTDAGAAVTPVDAAAPVTETTPVVVEPEAPKPQRIFFGRNKVKRLQHNLGDKMGQFMLLDLADAELEGEALTAKQEATVEVIKAMGDKVQNRATNMIEFVSGKSNRLNSIAETALRMLAKDGKLTSGDKGNLHLKLLARPYGVTSARAMGNNTLNMLKQLRLVVEDGKQTYVPNPNSAMLAMVSDKLALTFTDNDAAVAEAEAEEAAALETKPELAAIEPVVQGASAEPTLTPVGNSVIDDLLAAAAQQGQLELVAA